MTVANFVPRINAVHHVGLSCRPIPPTSYGGIEYIIAALLEACVVSNQPAYLYSPGDGIIDGVNHVKTAESHQVQFDGGRMITNSTEHLQNTATYLAESVRSGDVVHFHSSDHFKSVAKSLPDDCYVFETAHWLVTGAPKNIVFPSAALQGRMQKPGFVIHHGIDLGVFKPTSGELNDQYLFYAGRFTPDKGLMLAIELARFLDIKLVAAGPLSGTEFEDQVLPHVEYLGELPHTTLPEYYSKAAAFLFLSDYCEPFGLAPVEAMACGCPVICSGQGGLRETIIDGRTGYFVKSVADFAKIKLDELRTMRDACKVQASRFSKEKMGRLYLELYQYVCG